MESNNKKSKMNRRNSILKEVDENEPVKPSSKEEFKRRSSKRVSFAGTQPIKEFLKDTATEWNDTYDEPVKHDSSSSSMEVTSVSFGKIVQSTSHINEVNNMSKTLNEGSGSSELARELLPPLSSRDLADTDQVNYGDMSLTCAVTTHQIQRFMQKTSESSQHRDFDSTTSFETKMDFTYIEKAVSPAEHVSVGEATDEDKTCRVPIDLNTTCFNENLNIQFTQPNEQGCEKNCQRDGKGETQMNESMELTCMISSASRLPLLTGKENQDVSNIDTKGTRKSIQGSVTMKADDLNVSNASSEPLSEKSVNVLDLIRSNSDQLIQQSPLPPNDRVAISSARSEDFKERSVNVLDLIRTNSDQRIDNSSLYQNHQLDMSSAKSDNLNVKSINILDLIPSNFDQLIQKSPQHQNFPNDFSEIISNESQSENYKLVQNEKSVSVNSPKIEEISCPDRPKGECSSIGSEFNGESDPICSPFSASSMDNEIEDHVKDFPNSNIGMLLTAPLTVETASSEMKYCLGDILQKECISEPSNSSLHEDMSSVFEEKNSENKENFFESASSPVDQPANFNNVSSTQCTSFTFDSSTRLNKEGNSSEMPPNLTIDQNTLDDKQNDDPLISDHYVTQTEKTKFCESESIDEPISSELPLSETGNDKQENISVTSTDAVNEKVVSQLTSQNSSLLKRRSSETNLAEPNAKVQILSNRNDELPETNLGSVEDEDCSLLETVNISLVSNTTHGSELEELDFSQDDVFSNPSQSVDFVVDGDKDKSAGEIIVPVENKDQDSNLNDSNPPTTSNKDSTSLISNEIDISVAKHQVNSSSLHSEIEVKEKLEPAKSDEIQQEISNNIKTPPNEISSSLNQKAIDTTQPPNALHCEIILETIAVDSEIFGNKSTREGTTISTIITPSPCTKCSRTFLDRSYSCFKKSKKRGMLEMKLKGTAFKLILDVELGLHFSIKNATLSPSFSESRYMPAKLVSKFFETAILDKVARVNGTTLCEIQVPVSEIEASLKPLTSLIRDLRLVQSLFISRWMDNCLRVIVSNTDAHISIEIDINFEGDNCPDIKTHPVVKIGNIRTKTIEDALRSVAEGQNKLYRMMNTIRHLLSSLTST